MFKQQRFLQETDENNGQCQGQSVPLLTAGREVGDWGGESRVEGPTDL